MSGPIIHMSLAESDTISLQFLVKMSGPFILKEMIGPFLSPIFS